MTSVVFQMIDSIRKKKNYHAITLYYYKFKSIYIIFQLNVYLWNF